MGKGFVLWSLLLHLLLLMCAQGIGARDMNRKHRTRYQIMGRNGDQFNVLRLPSMEDDDNEMHEANLNNQEHHDHRMMQMDPQLTSLFLRMKDLKVGKTSPIHFTKLDPTLPKFLPREISESIPFTYKELPRLLKLFSESPQAINMEGTLRACDSKPMYGEIKFCATSLESLLDSVRDMLEGETHFYVLTPRLLTESKTTYQNYTIREMPEEIKVPRVVPCHPMGYPYGVFFCHWLNQTKVFKVSLEGENGDRVETLVACHLNTTGWNPDHMAFEVLGTKPGSSEVCHYFPADNLLWVPHVNV